MSFKAFPGGIILGAGLVYFLDPVRGRKRRARIVELATHVGRVERTLVGKAVRDAQHRARGLSERVRHPPSEDAPDPVIEARVRAQLGRWVSHPGSIDVVANQGRVILRGPILEHEAAGLLRATAKIPGVKEVIDSLERHARPDRTPGLQGQPRGGRTTWTPLQQVAAIGTGLVLAGYGLFVRRGVFGLLYGGAGTALALRGAVNKPLPVILGVRPGITIQKTIAVEAPVEKVFGLWSSPENFPRFMEHVHKVEKLDDKRSVWRVDGPAGRQVAFDAEVTRVEPNRVIAWRTLPNQPIEHEGMIHFEQHDGTTRLQIQMTYRPPAGVVGHAIAHLLGWDPKSRMDQDLVRMKALLEDGYTRAHHERVSIDQLQTVH